MLVKIANNSNGPFDIETEDGPRSLPPGTEIEASISSELYSLLSRSPLLHVINLEASLTELAEKYESLAGVKPDGRWSLVRLQQEISKLEK